MTHRRSIRTEATFVAAVSTGLLCAVLAVLLIRSAHEELVTEAVRDGVHASSSIIQSLESGTTPDLELSEYTSFAQLVTDEGQVIARSPELVGKPAVTDAQRTARNERSYEIAPSAFYPNGALEVNAQRVDLAGKPVSLYVFSPVPPVYLHPLAVLILIGWTLLVALVSGMITWRWLGKRMREVEAIRHELAEITVSDLTRRVPRPPRDDEVGRLADTVNATLDRLECSVEQQRRFASDASHDLRTPIAAMRVELESALMHPKDTDWIQSAHALQDSVERLHSIVVDLLQLAQLESGAEAEHVEPVDLAALVATETEHRPHKVETRIVLAPEVVVAGNQLQLARLLNNLMDNAERHTATHVQVSVQSEGNDAVLSVADDGAGVAPADREKIFQRFVRLEASRNRDSGGTGLGLPIAQGIAQAHGGTLEVVDADPGACFVLRLPQVS